ncbi:hypothetical protein AAY55_13685 [Vibrio metoecus]|uniref:Uncharacterized protein n=1 Tax=Vibrio metoecus TaxID=1481663 RepID=A0A0Q0NAB0_VIBMT|nr:hypothetical protein AAY55_13685 [Vibrio metoecus]
MQKHQANTRPTPKACEVGCQNSKRYKVKLATVKSPRQRKHTFSDDAAFVKSNFPCGASNNIEASKLDGFLATLKLLNIQHFLPSQHQKG